MPTAFKHLYNTALTMTPHIKGPPLVEAHQPIHEIAADHALDQPTGQLRKTLHQNPSHSRKPHRMHTIREIKESP